MPLPQDPVVPRKKVYLHIGLHKTGTTYLQNVMRANRKALAEQEICFPRGEQRHQTLAVWDLFGRRPKGTADARINGQWEALVSEVDASPWNTVLVSEEYLSLATVALAKRAVAAFPDAEVHVIVTARDLGRVLVSAWQEDIKNDTTWTWEQFAAAARDPAARAKSPARGFWLRQDLPAIAETWASVVTAERIHIVTVPPSGAGSSDLLERFTSVVGSIPRLSRRSPSGTTRRSAWRRRSCCGG